MGAFEVAREAGFDWIEFDVWSSADGVPVIMHDETLERTSEGTGPIIEKTSQELSRINLRGSGRDGSEKVPVGLPAGAWAMLVEVKPPDDRKLVESIVGTMKARQTPWTLQSFHAKNLLHAWAIDPGVPAALLVESREELERAIEERWPVIHPCHEALDEGVVERMRGAGIGVGAWTVNEEEDIRRVVSLRLDTIITDVPRRVRRVIEEMNECGVCEAQRSKR